MWRINWQEEKIAQKDAWGCERSERERKEQEEISVKKSCVINVTHLLYTVLLLYTVATFTSLRVCVCVCFTVGIPGYTVTNTHTQRTNTPKITTVRREDY